MFLLRAPAGRRSAEYPRPSRKGLCTRHDTHVSVTGSRSKSIETGNPQRERQRYVACMVPSLLHHFAGPLSCLRFRALLDAHRPVVSCSAGEVAAAPMVGETNEQVRRYANEVGCDLGLFSPSGCGMSSATPASMASQQWKACW